MILIQDGSQNTNVDKPLRIIGDPYKVQVRLIGWLSQYFEAWMDEEPNVHLHFLWIGYYCSYAPAYKGISCYSTVGFWYL